MKFFIEAVNLLGPGLNGWQQSMPVLREEVELTSLTMAPVEVHHLPANERRRMTATLKLSLAVLEEFIHTESFNSTQTATVFASSCGDIEIACNICQALTQPDRPVSPTQFHNSVHNAAAGYWSIALKSNKPSTSISAYDSTFAAGLLEVATLALTEQRQALLVAYDQVPVAPVGLVRKVTWPFATALLVSAEKTTRSLCEVSLHLHTGLQDTVLKNKVLESIRISNPAARSLPLLKAIADKASLELSLAYLDDSHVQLDIRRCN